MNTEERIRRLESLLDRVQRNAAGPRAPTAALTAAADEAPSISVEEQYIDEPIEMDMDEEDIEDVELLDEDIVELPSDAPPAAEQDDFGLDFDDEEVPERTPASSRRPKAASSMDEALAGAADQLDADEEREIPIKTPPPESGPQAATPPPAGADDDELIEPFSTAEPTAAQLGNTIQLDEGGADRLELDAPDPEPEAAHAHELELTLPAKEPAGAFDEDLPPPSQVEQDLARHRARQAERERAYERVDEAPPISAQAPSVLRPELVARPELGDVPVADIVSAAREFRPASFSELLDASLALGSDER